MLTERKLRKMYKSRKAPDISHRIPALANSNEMQKERRTINYKRVAVCACLAVILIATFIVAAFYNGNNGGEGPGNTIVVDNSTSKTEGNESKENETTDDGKDHVIQNNSSEDNDSKNDVIINDSSMDDNSKDDVIYNDSSDDDNSKNDVIHNDSSKDDDGNNGEVLVIFGNEETDYLGMVESSPEQGVLQIGLDLEEQLDKNENKDCLFAVEFCLYSAIDDPDYKDERYLKAIEEYRVLRDCGNNLNSMYSELNGYLNSDIKFDFFIGALYWWRTCISFDEIEAFTKQLFGEEDMEALRALYNANDNQLNDRAFLEKSLSVLGRITYNKHYDISGWEQTAFIDGAVLKYTKSLNWLIQKRIDYFKQMGIEIKPIDPIVAALNYVEGADVFSAVLTKEQIYNLENSKYGVVVFLQGKESYQMD